LPADKGAGAKGPRRQWEDYFGCAGFNLTIINLEFAQFGTGSV
jgi:hypothetical protein